MRAGDEADGNVHVPQAWLGPELPRAWEGRQLSEVAVNFAPPEVIVRDMLKSQRAVDDFLAYSDRWARHADLIRTQIQETGHVRLSFLTLADLVGAMNDLGISLHEVEFKNGYAVVKS